MPPLKIEIVIFPDVQLLDVAGPLQVFATANEQSSGDPRRRPYATRIVSHAASTIMTSSGLGLAAEPLTAPDAELDTLIVPGGPGVHPASNDRHLRDWVLRRAAVARRVVSVCTGAFLLAETGLLDGRRVATHWTGCVALARRYPAITVEPDPIFVQDGSVWTSAGVTAGIDLALALVEADLGAARALAVARHLVVFLKRPGGQAQFSTALELQGADDPFAMLHAWMVQNLDTDLSVPVLANEVGMSVRSFARRYRATCGVTPAEAVERLRLESARTLLSQTGLPIKRIATRCGFGSEETLRRCFLRHLAVSPNAYRARFAMSPSRPAADPAPIARPARR